MNKLIASADPFPRQDLDDEGPRFPSRLVVLGLVIVSLILWAGTIGAVWFIGDAFGLW